MKLFYKNKNNFIITSRNTIFLTKYFLFVIMCMKRVFLLYLYIPYCFFHTFDKKIN